MSPTDEHTDLLEVPAFIETKLEHFSPKCARKPQSWSPKRIAMIPNLIVRMIGDVAHGR